VIGALYVSPMEVQVTEILLASVYVRAQSADWTVIDPNNRHIIYGDTLSVWPLFNAL